MFEQSKTDGEVLSQQLVAEEIVRIIGAEKKDSVGVHAGGLSAAPDQISKHSYFEKLGIALFLALILGLAIGWMGLLAWGFHRVLLLA